MVPFLFPNNIKSKSTKRGVLLGKTFLFKALVAEESSKKRWRRDNR